MCLDVPTCSAGAAAFERVEARGDRAIIWRSRALSMSICDDVSSAGHHPG
jgi:hypothetical protein